MNLKELLEKIGVLKEDAAEILAADGVLRKEITPISEAYMNTDREKCQAFVKEAEEKARGGVDGYMAQLLFWLYCMPRLREEYLAEGLAEDIFYHSMADFTYKIKECKQMKGKVGVFVDWFAPFFEKKMFALGRLQYHHYPLYVDSYTLGDFSLQKGDTVYQCHIPSSGKLLLPDVMDSLDKAYHFYKKELKGSIIPVCCASWMLFPDYQGSVFSEGSNIAVFASLFDIIDVYPTEAFNDFWRVFGVEYAKRDKGVPTDTSLRRAFVRYMEKGGRYGAGYGIILYDGEKKQIVNQKV